MKIAVVSDTHSFVDKAVDAIKREGNIDIVIHLGDYVVDAIRIKEQLGVDLICVRGNGDPLEIDTEEDKLIEIENKKIFATHGHNYGVYNELNSVFLKGKELNADVVLFGHTHIALLLEHEGVLVLNPGSPEEPRSGTKGSIGMLEIENNEVKGKIILV